MLRFTIPNRHTSQELGACGVDGKDLFVEVLGHPGFRIALSVSNHSPIAPGCDKAPRFGFEPLEFYWAYWVVRVIGLQNKEQRFGCMAPRLP
jgi:hypothetical protein